MNKKRKLRKNISISYIYNFLQQINITSAIWVLYLSFKGMSLIEIGLIESIYHLTAIVLELPTGAIADLYGKKLSLITGRILCIASSIIMINSSSFLGFALAFILSAASNNLNSGAAEALIYDSLKVLGEENKYKKIWASLAFYMSVAQGIAVLLGGVLSDINFIYAYILAIAIETVALIVNVQFSEPNTSFENSQSERITMVGQLRTSMNVLKGRRIILYLILFSALLSSLQTTVFFYSQKYFENMNYSKTAIALICAGGNFIDAICSKYAYSFEKKFKLKGTFIFISIVSIVSLIGLGTLKKFSIIFYILTSVTSGLTFTIFSDYINSGIPSKYRATILSLDSLFFSIFMICVFPLFGVMADEFGFYTTFISLAIMYIPVIVLLMYKIKKHKNIGGIYDDSISFE